MQVKDLTIEEFKHLIQETVTDTIQDLLSDPDTHQSLRPEVAQALIKSLDNTQRGQAGVAAEDVAQSLGIDW
ncbi:MAG: hypothetical protein ACPGVO_12250 [Spirulinaceae cyanobacterium]